VVSVTAGPGNEMAAGAGGHGRLRASHADRQQVIDVLQDAFVQGMLDNDELDARVGQAFASRTYAELAALTADIPARSAATEPVPASAAARTLAKAARRSGVCVLIAFALVGVVALTNAENLAGPAFVFGIVAVIAASGFLGYGAVDAWQERRSRGQLPPRPGRDGKGLERGRPSRSGRDRAPTGTRHGQNRTDMRTRSSRPGRPRSSRRGAPAPHSMRPVPGAL
jgi:Domain of unknown function (DUF1707)